MLHARSGQRVVVLVDEYDQPILDHITGATTAREMRARGGPIHLIGVEFSQAERLDGVSTMLQHAGLALPAGPRRATAGRAVAI